MTKVAALASGGLDSAIMLADLAADSQVYPIYVEAGLVWERAEKASLERFMAALAQPNIEPVTYLSVPTGPIIGSHWSVTGQGVPGARAPDSEMFIPGRNVLLIAVTSVWCSTHDVGRIAVGSLGGNPFPDATQEFFESFGNVLSTGLGHEIKIESPFRGRNKAGLIRSHSGLPLELTLTCANPPGPPLNAPRSSRGRPGAAPRREGTQAPDARPVPDAKRPALNGASHCGDCNKCTERLEAFQESGVEDRTRYLA
ncbi:MAG: 7-cyano-7-deazaguanine synthase [Chloroflexi bacterium]|nr:7-cyano-7-deazaguanine synthase [Chloroflexota bacterium]